MWKRVHQTKFHNAEELNQRMLDMWHGLKQSVIDDALLISCASSMTLLTFSLFHMIQLQCFCTFIL